MKLFCFQDHKPQQEKPSLIELEAELARVELLPDSDFTIWGNPLGGVVKHGVDQKQIVIARLKADIASEKILSQHNGLTKA